MASTPAYAATAAASLAAISTANTNRDGTGTIVDVGSAAPAAGRMIDEIEVTATGATTAGVVRLYIHNGTSWFLWKELMVDAITPSTSVQAWTTTLTGLRKLLSSGWKLGAAPHNAETFNVHVNWAGDLT